MTYTRSPDAVPVGRVGVTASAFADVVFPTGVGVEAAT
jgi:hypothetical protein